ncbi:Hypothetical protein A7982_07513 [Minicystis rosea]|nr:Hypothetical protein A7982_07513 [Minicystis rosea]
MDIAHTRSQSSDADDDVNVKNSYVDCWYIAPKTRELSKTPNVPPLPRAGGI